MHIFEPLDRVSDLPAPYDTPASFEASLWVTTAHGSTATGTPLASVDADGAAALADGDGADAEAEGLGAAEDGAAEAEELTAGLAAGDVLAGEELQAARSTAAPKAARTVDFGRDRPIETRWLMVQPPDGWR